jgi:hypothetical protein
MDQRLGVKHFVLAVLAKLDCRNQMGGQCGQADGAYLRIGSHLAAGVALRTKVLAVLGAVRHAEGGAIDCPQRKPLPLIGCFLLCAPGLGCLFEQPLQRGLAKARTRLRDGAFAHRFDSGVGQGQIQGAEHLFHRLPTKQRQCNDQPNHLFCRQTAAANTRYTMRVERLFNPFIRQMCRQTIEADRWHDICRNGELAGQHRPPR